jgi:hypothetical protein
MYRIFGDDVRGHRRLLGELPDVDAVGSDFLGGAVGKGIEALTRLGYRNIAVVDTSRHLTVRIDRWREGEER